MIKFIMKTILLIGGAGYVGSVLAYNFLRLGYKVKVLDYFVYDNQVNKNYLVENVTVDDEMICQYSGLPSLKSYKKPGLNNWYEKK